MILNFVAYHDRPFDKEHELTDPLGQQGFRFISRSIYGSPSSPFYAGVMVLRDVVIAQHWFRGLTTPEFLEQLFALADIGFAPIVIDATGPSSDPRFAVVFEPTPGGPIPRTIFNAGREQFEQENATARAGGDILRSAAIYGEPGNRLYAGVWWPNPAGVRWSLFIDEDATATQQIFDGMLSQWGRLVFMTSSADGRYISLYREDRIGPFNAIHNATSGGYQQRVNELSPGGFFPIQVQGAGDVATQARFAAVLAAGDEILPREFRVKGPTLPALAPLDALMELGMKKTGVRAAQLAVACRGQLVHNRAYTWAEADYPTTQPDNIFRIASASKALTAIVALQLVDLGVLGLDDLVQPILKLSPPPDMSFSGPGFVDQIKVRHLLNRLSGLDHTDPTTPAVAAAFKHPQDFAVTKRELISFALCNMKFKPGGPVPAGVDSYSNTAFVLLGMVIEAKTGLTYEETVRQLLLKPLGIKTPRISKALAKDRAPGEVFHHGRLFTVGRSAVTPDQPWVATPYGAGGDMLLGDASGSWSMSAADFTRVLGALDLDAPSPVFGKAGTRQTLWDSFAWESPVPFDNSLDSAGKPTKSRCKGGSFDGTGAATIHRDDGLTAAAFANLDAWPSDTGMSLSGLDQTWHNFQVIERLNLLTASPAYPFSLLRLWRVDSNGFGADLVIDSIDDGGKLKGKFVAASGTDVVRGLWNKAERKLTLIRQGAGAASTQVYTGYLMDGDDVLAGSFEAFAGTGGQAGRSVFGWVARLPAFG